MDKQADGLLGDAGSLIKDVTNTGINATRFVYNKVKDMGMYGAPLALGTPFLMGYGIGKIKDHLDLPQETDIAQVKREALSEEYEKAIRAIKRRRNMDTITAHTGESEQTDDAEEQELGL